jgi:demethylmenaquinone methyltransferase/2-methoxy-6-polyprenyl-1,4-benzoquinol methylase
VQNIIGVDVSELMIDLAQEKQIRFSSKRWMHSKKVLWKFTDAVKNGLDSESVDVATCAFGIRNIPDRAAFLNEVHRLLKSKGKLAILEFSLPANPLFRYPYKFYLNCIMPWLAKWIVGDKEPLRYLARSISHWHTEVDFSSELSRTGFTLVRKVPLTGGIAALWVAIKK